jgi:hypothetical protein
VPILTTSYELSKQLSVPHSSFTLLICSYIILAFSYGFCLHLINELGIFLPIFPSNVSARIRSSIFLSLSDTRDWVDRKIMLSNVFSFMNGRELGLWIYNSSSLSQTSRALFQELEYLQEINFISLLLLYISVCSVSFSDISSSS